MPVKDNKRKCLIEWKVEDLLVKEDKDDDDSHVLEGTCGLASFNFTNYEVTNHCGKAACVNFMKLFFHLWPGDIKQQLLVMNARIA